jgi:hypothetical protein
MEAALCIITAILTCHIRFSNRPFGVKRFQTIRRVVGAWRATAILMIGFLAASSGLKDESNESNRD